MERTSSVVVVVVVGRKKVAARMASETKKILQGRTEWVMKHVRTTSDLQRTYEEKGKGKGKHEGAAVQAGDPWVAVYGG